MDRFTETFTKFHDSRYDEIPTTIIDELKERHNSISEKSDLDIGNCLKIFEKYYHSPTSKINLPDVSYVSISEDRIVINKNILPNTRKDIYKTIEKVDVHKVNMNRIYNHQFYDYEINTPVIFSFKYLYKQQPKNLGKQRSIIKNYIKPYAVLPSKTGNSLFLSLPKEIVNYFDLERKNIDISWKVGIVDNSTDEILLIPYETGSRFSITESSIINEKEFLTGEIVPYFNQIQFYREPGTGHITDSGYKIKFTYWKELFQYNEFERTYQDITLSEYPPYALFIDFFGQIHLQRMTIIPESYHDRSHYKYIPTAILSQLFKEAQSYNKQITSEEVLQKTNFSYTGFCPDDFESICQ